MGYGRRLANVLGGVVLAGGLVACGAANKAPALDTLPAHDIYLKGEAELSAKRPKDAAKLFVEVERLYPYSQWAKRAVIMSAFAYYTNKDYANARASAQRYMDLYPADEDAAYAQYIVALSYYDQIDKVGRDQGLTFKALQALRKVIENYPNSEYARSAILKFDFAFDQLAAKEMEVGRYYLKHHDFAAAISRFRVVVENYQTTASTPEALSRLVEAYLSLGLDSEAQTAGAILGYNFRSTQWYRDSYALLTGKGLRPDARSTGWLRTIYRRTIKGKWL